MRRDVTSREREPWLRLIHTAGFIIGSVLLVVSVAMFISALVALAYRELLVGAQIALAGGITAVTGFGLRRVSIRPRTMSVKQGFATVGLTWLIFSLFGTLPYLLTGSIGSIPDAIFESTSGFTTTGFSVVLDPNLLPRGVLFWRGFTQWIGGLGVIILGVIVLPLLGTGGVQLAQAEVSGPTLDRLAPRFQDTAKRLLVVYLVMTVAAFFLLWFGDMTGFQALFHAFTSVATGGFGTESTSIAGFSTYTQWVITFFMVASAMSFALHYRGFFKPSEYWRSSEFRLYMGIVVVAAVIVVGGLWQQEGPADAIRLGVFNSVTIVSDTGFTTADIDTWRPTLQIMVIGLMFLGGMAGSTAGAIKTFRVGVLAKAAFADVRRVVHPKAMLPTRFGGRTVPEHVVEAVQSFFLFYMLIFMTAVFLLAFIDANLGEELDFVTVVSAVASSMGNVGTGVGQVGPSGPGFTNFPDLAKLLLSGLMIVGRLEIFPVLVLFTRDLWKR